MWIQLCFMQLDNESRVLQECFSGKLSLELVLQTAIILIIMVIFKCYFTREHIALSLKKLQKQCVH